MLTCQVYYNIRKSDTHMKKENICNTGLSIDELIDMSLDDGIDIFDVLDEIGFDGDITELI